MNDDEFLAWYSLAEAPGLGRTKARQLLQAHGSPQAALQAAGVQALPADWERARTWLHGGPDRFVLSLADAPYPAALLESPDPPLLLYGQGDARALNTPSLAIVGSRSASAQGRDHAHRFALELGQRGWTIVSGLALGIDAAAHEGALQGPCATVAVVGTGLDTVYPQRHAGLARAVALKGAVISEFAPGVPARAANFPQRNRIIAGLSAGTLVVEAAPGSGSLITARLAAEAGREVFAIPGSIHSPLSRGCHALIRQGAKLVETVQDLLDELPALMPTLIPAGPCLQAPEADAPVARRADDSVLQGLGEDPLTLDELGLRTGSSAAELGARLIELELQGRVARLPGGRFQRRHAA